MTEQNHASPSLALLRRPEVTRRTGLSRSTLYARMKVGTFPKPVSLGDRCVGWVDSEVHDWILARIEERDMADGTALRPTSRLSVAG